MSLTSYVRRLAVGEQHCKVIIEVADLGATGWRRLTADPELRWRRLTGSRLGTSALRRRRGRAEPAPRTEATAPTPALLEASGVASGTATVAKQRLAATAMARLHAAGLDGVLLGAAPADPSAPRPEASAAELAWPASADVLIFGPAEPDELNRRFAVAASAWSLDAGSARPPLVTEPAERRRRAQMDVITGLCVLPLLLMLVATVGPWLDQRSWTLLLVASLVCVALSLLAVRALSRWHRFLVRVRGRGLAVGALLLVVVLVARVATRIPVPPLAVVIASAVLAAVFTPVALRLLPAEVPVRAAATGVPLALALVATPVGDLLDGVYLDRLGLRATDVSLTVAQRWWSGAFFGVTALAGLALGAAFWGWVRRLDAMGRRRAVPPASMVALCGTVYGAVLLAMAASVAWHQGEAAPGELPGRWGGIAPVW
ncbi:MAG: hypothetical protein J2P19_06125, partial [Pseudonocardia sp.]|nr:hypothetical protein [Pseudonocardia sp.]